LFSTNKLSLNDSSVSSRTARGADTGTEANTASIGVIEGLGSFFRLKFHALIRFKIQQVPLRKINFATSTNNSTRSSSCNTVRRRAIKKILMVNMVVNVKGILVSVLTP
ncbi:hypothetical protein CFOL_v3_28244, partial [Cephalotus follicularis]